MDNLGEDIGESNVGLDECRNKCSNRADCVGFLYCSGCTGLFWMSTCYLKDKMVTLTYDAILMNFYEKGTIT